MFDYLWHVIVRDMTSGWQLRFYMTTLIEKDTFTQRRWKKPLIEIVLPLLSLHKMFIGGDV